MPRKPTPPAKRSRTKERPKYTRKFFELLIDDAESLHRTAVARFGGVETQVLRVVIHLAEAVYTHPATVAAMSWREALDAYAIARAAELAAGDGTPDADPAPGKD